MNETFARKNWQGGNPIGKFIVVDHTDPTPREIVGIVGDIKHYGLMEESTAEIYEPFRQHPYGFITLVLKTDAGGQAAAAFHQPRGA